MRTDDHLLGGAAVDVGEQSALLAVPAVVDGAERAGVGKRRGGRHGRELEAHSRGVVVGLLALLLLLRTRPLEVLFDSHLGRLQQLLLQRAFRLVHRQLPPQSSDFGVEGSVDSFGLPQLLPQIIVLTAQHGFGPCIDLHFKTCIQIGRKACSEWSVGSNSIKDHAGWAVHCMTGWLMGEERRM
jgi:hypothetical protein